MADRDHLKEAQEISDDLIGLNEAEQCQFLEQFAMNYKQIQKTAHSLENDFSKSAIAEKKRLMFQIQRRHNVFFTIIDHAHALSPKMQQTLIHVIMNENSYEGLKMPLQEVVQSLCQSAQEIYAEYMEEDSNPSNLLSLIRHKNGDNTAKD